MASPIQSQVIPIGEDYLLGYTINGDVLNILGLNNFPHFDTDSSLMEPPLLAAANVVDVIPLKWKWGRIIHNVNYSYLTYPPSVTRTKALVSELADECTAGSITVSPSTMTVPLETLTKVPFQVWNRNGRLLDGREVFGGGVHWTMSQDSSVYGIDPTPGEFEGLTLWGGSQTLGNLTVAVSSIPFTGTINTRKHAWWTWADSYATDTGSPPPVPSSDPSWDGTPGDCSKITRTYGSVGYADWAQACERFYTFDMNPMPIPIRVSIILAGYPDGSLFEPNGSFFVAAHQAVTDTVGHCVGAAYCFRMGLVKGLTSGGGGVLDSLTFCLSDKCVPSAPAPAGSAGAATAFRLLNPPVRPGHGAVEPPSSLRTRTSTDSLQHLKE